MKQYFIDRFIIPRNAEEEFVRRMNYNRNFIKGLPGFIADNAYMRNDEEGSLIIMTVAQWESEGALNKAKEAVQAEYKRIGFNPAEMAERLKIKTERGIYTEFIKGYEKF